MFREMTAVPIYKITYSGRFKRATLYNYGCNFDCAWCSYQLKDNPQPTRFLNLERVKETLRELDIDRVHFVGGEPTSCPDLPEIAEFAHNELGVFTKIGHSTGFNMPPDNIDAISISIKTLSENIHRRYTGVSNSRILENFKAMGRKGIYVDASSVLIPGLVDKDEIERIARFIAGIDPGIPYHIIGYVAVPGAPWRKPTPDEVKEAVVLAERYLGYVTSSCLTVEDFLSHREWDVRYDSMTVA